jgi:hypothetical protein
MKNRKQTSVKSENLFVIGRMKYGSRFIKLEEYSDSHTENLLFIHDILSPYKLSRNGQLRCLK